MSVNGISSYSTNTYLYGLLTNISSDSNLNSITNLDSYIQGSSTASELNIGNYSAGSNTSVSNLLTNVSDSGNLLGITDLNNYAMNNYLVNQLNLSDSSGTIQSVDNQLNYFDSLNSLDGINNLFGTTNLNDFVQSSFLSDSINQTQAVNAYNNSMGYSYGSPTGSTINTTI